MAGPPPATIRVGNPRQTKTKPTGLLVAILMAQNSCLGGQPIRSFNSCPPNQRPTNQSKVTIHLASNNPAGGYKRQKRTRNPDARGAAAKAGNEEKRKNKKQKNREREERKGRNGKQERQPSKRRRRRKPSSIQFNGELSRALSQSDNGDDEGQDGGSIERASDQASDQVTKPTNQASRQSGDLAMK